MMVLLFFKSISWMGIVAAEKSWMFGIESAQISGLSNDNPLLFFSIVLKFLSEGAYLLNVTQLLLQKFLSERAGLSRTCPLYLFKICLSNLLHSFVVLHTI